MASADVPTQISRHNKIYSCPSEIRNNRNFVSYGYIRFVMIPDWVSHIPGPFPTGKGLRVTRVGCPEMLVLLDDNQWNPKAYRGEW